MESDLDWIGRVTGPATVGGGVVGAVEPEGGVPGAGGVVGLRTVTGDEVGFVGLEGVVPMTVGFVGVVGGVTTTSGVFSPMTSSLSRTMNESADALFFVPSAVTTTVWLPGVRVGLV